MCGSPDVVLGRRLAGVRNREPWRYGPGLVEKDDAKVASARRCGPECGTASWASKLAVFDWAELGHNVLFALTI
ncbi:hypothetical protein GUJ93_ZPchr0001g32852 [Zizania palustris]|uniref:Uncharacterized protein n=1 Tax=Zizania palustris TaxID=103762 RepID=A0A8J5RYC8_ZIZPA|nr:hypothetical protein GUJ93_ZPchr0001g32852 [Zizania palustris]